MARHSHWAQIKLKKGAEDRKRGKIFTKHAHLIATAARAAGGDPNMNAGLRLAVENARAANMPKENIERAIKKGTGELKDDEKMEEVTYEGFGPGGSAIIIEALTNNKNRTNQMVRLILQKNGGNLGSSGAAGFLFESKGVIRVKAKAAKDADELEIIDAGAEDLEEDEGSGIGDQGSEFIVYTAANALGEIRKKLQEKGFQVISAELAKVPKNPVMLENPAEAQKLAELIEALEEEEDITNVYTNVTF